jgi:hypothetical protein
VHGFHGLAHARAEQVQQFVQAVEDLDGQGRVHGDRLIVDYINLLAQ